MTVNASELSDETLQAAITARLAWLDEKREGDGTEYDPVRDYFETLNEIEDLREELAQRAAVARLTDVAPLTHTPFTVLVL